MDDKTKIPLGWIFGLIGAMITAFAFAGGIIVWGASLDTRSNEVEQRVSAMEVKQASAQQNYDEIISRLARIEGYLQKSNNRR